MKKIISLLLLTLLLVGCTDAYVNVSDPKEEVLSIGETSYTKDTLFSLMINQDPATLVVQMAKQKILNKEMPINEDVKAKAQEELDYVKEIFGEEFLTNITLYGFADEDDYLERALIPASQEILLTEKFVEDNFDLVTAKYTPKKIRVIEYSEEEEAASALQSIKDGANVEEVAKDTSTSTSYNGKERLVHSESQLPAVVTTFISDNDIPTLTSEPLFQESSSKYYIVQIVETSPSRFEAEIKEELSALTSVNEMVFEKYFIDGNFAVYDKGIYDSIKTSYSNYLN